jgi:hypothetical protein
MQLPNLLDSGTIVFPRGGTTLSVKESARRCEFAFPLSLRHFINNHTPTCPFLAGVRLHLKVLQEPNVSISTMLKSMRLVYRDVPLTVEVVSRETLTRLPNFFPDKTGIPNFDTLLDLDVGPCVFAQALTTEQTQLYQNRNNVNNNIDIVVYFVRQVLRNNTDALNGCADPRNVLPPNIAIAQTASRWTLAHEVGHKLGLNHITGESTNCPPGGPTDCCNTPDSTRLMTGCGTGLIPVGTTPSLVRTERDTMISSILVQDF